MGQYEDQELGGLYYNRFRYYDGNTGTYISQDPIGLEGNNPNFYAYVYDSNTEIDPLGLFFGKIIGNAQKTGTFGHSFVSKMYAQIYSLNPKVERVTMDLGYKKLLGGGNFKWGPRPDVGILYKNGKVKIIEVASKTDKIPNLISRNSDFMLKNNIVGDVKVSKIAQKMNSFKDKVKKLLKSCR